jgi:hypothetical protein
MNSIVSSVVATVAVLSVMTVSMIDYQVGYVYSSMNWVDILSLSGEEKIDYCWNNFHNKSTNNPMSQSVCQTEMNEMRDICSSDNIDPLLLKNGTMKATVGGVELRPEEIEGILVDGWTIQAPQECSDPLRSYRINNFEIIEKELVISE